MHFDNSKLHFCNIEEQYNLITFATSKGFYVFSICPFTKILENFFTFSINCVVNIQKSNIFLFCSGNILYVWDQLVIKIINSIKFKENIITIKSSENSIFIQLENDMRIYDNQLQFKKNFPFTNKNTIYHFHKNLLIYYFENIIYIYNIQLNELKVFQESVDIGYITTDYNNHHIILSNKIGTRIRILNLKSKEFIKELYRGFTDTTILNIQYNNNLQYLLCTSIKSTIHIYDFQKTLLTDILGKSSDYKFYVKHKQFYTKFIDNTTIVVIDETNIYFLKINEGSISIDKIYKFMGSEDELFKSRNNFIY